MFAVKCADHCASCPISGEAKCDECDEGYFMTRQGACVAIVGEFKTDDNYSS